jgi:hypothetical protein
MRIAYFTAGTVGAGDLLHSLAIERALGRAGFQGEYRAFGAESPFSFAQYGSFQPVPIRMEELQVPDTALESELAGALADYAPS